MELSDINNEEGDAELSWDWTVEVLHRLSKINIESLLDIGCGKGKYLSLVRQSSPHSKLFGTEVNSSKVAQFRASYPDQKDNVVFGQPMDYFKPNSFDVITMFDVIEHIPDPTRFISENVYPLLKPAGVFIFQTPNRIPNSIKETLEWKSFSLWKSEHCSLQNRRTLRDLLLMSGFTNLQFSKFHFDSDFKRIQLHKLIPWVSPDVLISIINNLPKVLYPNIWGYATK